MERNTGTPKRARRQRRERRVRLGVVGVDTAQLLIIDPAYIEPSWLEPKEDGLPGFMRLWDVASDADGVDEGQINFDNGISGKGVTFMPGFGDGLYEVWATIRDFGPPLGEAIVKVEILTDESVPE